MVKAGLLSPRDKNTRACKFSRILKILNHCRTEDDITGSPAQDAFIITQMVTNAINNTLSMNTSDSREKNSRDSRITQAVQSFNNFLLNTWPNERILGKLPGGPYFEFLNRSRRGDDNDSVYTTTWAAKRKIVLVVFVGGCTYSEISAMRDLYRKNDKVSFLILTTNIISGDRLIKSIIKSTLTKQQAVLR